MLSANSYRPEPKATREKSRDFLGKKNKSPKSKFNIKNDPKVLVHGIVYFLTSATLIACICFCAYKIIRWQAENDLVDNEIKTLQAETVITEIAEAETEPVVVKRIDSHKALSAADPYWTLIKTPLISVDLSSSKAKNSDVAGWVQVPGTNINYPFVQTDNNDYYLNHSLNRSWSSAGWVFLDYRNSTNLSDKNQILYAHGRIDGSMFGSLANVLSTDWQQQTEGHIVKISTETTDSLWQVFSTYRIPVTNDYIRTEFSGEDDFNEFIKMIMSRSSFDFDTSVSYNDRIITLSTCIGLNDRVVLHAKLIKIAQK